MEKKGLRINTQVGGLFDHSKEEGNRGCVEDRNYGVKQNMSLVTSVIF